MFIVVVVVVVVFQGDLTRHGERKLSGMVKDGYNSAYRYYLNIFSYPYRQAVIGEPTTDSGGSALSGCTDCVGAYWSKVSTCACKHTHMHACTHTHTHTHTHTAQHRTGHYRMLTSSVPADLMLGGSPSEVLKPVLQETSEEDDSLGVAWSLEREEVMVKMLDHCRRQLYPYYDPDKVKGYALCEPAGLR